MKATPVPNINHKQLKTDIEMGLNMLELKKKKKKLWQHLSSGNSSKHDDSAEIRQTVQHTFAMAARPEAGSGWPMLDFVEPISRGSRFDWQNTLTMPFTSCGSPTYMQRDVMSVLKARGQYVLVCDFLSRPEWNRIKTWPLFRFRGLQCIPPPQEICSPPGRGNEPTSAAFPLKEMLHL